MFLPNCRFRNLIKAVIVAVVLVSFVWLVFYTKNFIEERTQSHDVVSAVDEYLKFNKVSVNGIDCVPKEGLKTILIVGLDTDGKIVSSTSYNNEYDADFLMLAVFDNNNMLCKFVEINRDTIVPVRRLDIFGQVVDKQPMQLCLSYSFGDGLGQSAMNTKTAVSDLFYGLNIDYYVVLSRDAIRQAVDFLGGVEVVMDNDYTDVDESYERGSSHLLDSKQALEFISARWGTISGTNTYRMQRQMCFIDNIVSALQGSDCDFSGLYNSIVDYSLTDIDFTVFSRIMTYLDEYAVSPVVTPTGHSEVRYGHNEFYVDEQSVEDIVLNVFYDRV